MALALSTPDTGRFLVWELNDKIIACAVANPVADGIFNDSYFYVAENYRYQALWFLWWLFAIWSYVEVYICVCHLSWHTSFYSLRKRGYLSYMLEILFQPFRHNKKLILSGDAFNYMTESYERMGVVGRFNTACFTGTPVIKGLTQSEITITDVSWNPK